MRLERPFSFFFSFFWPLSKKHTREMDATVIIDYGQHTVKHGLLQHKRRPGKQQQQQQQKPDQSVFTVPSRDVDARFNMDVGAVGGHVASIVEEAGVRGSAFTMSFLTHPLLCVPAKELLLQCLFEEVKPQRIFLGYSPVCALFSSGAASSLVVDIGHFRTSIVPVWQGVPLTHRITTTFHGGAAVDAALVSQLHKQHQVPPQIITKELLHSIKSLNCFVPQLAGPSSPLLAGPPVHGAHKPLIIPLPDGQVVRVPLTDADYGAAGKCLFDSSSSSREPSPLQAAVDCARATFLENENICRSYLVTGGSSMMRGACEMLATVLPTCLPRAAAGPQDAAAFMQRRPLKDRDTAGWTGACILSHLSSFSSMCVDAATYAEEGPRRCLKVKTVDAR